MKEILMDPKTAIEASLHMVGIFGSFIIYDVVAGFFNEKVNKVACLHPLG